MAVEVRKVFLMDEQGNVIDCLLRSSFFNDLGGLGYDDNVTYMDYGDGFFSPVKRSSKQGTISGIMSFLDRGTAYEDYRKLMNWVSAAENMREDRAIKLCYRPYGADTFMKEVLLTSISKGELDVGGFLSCSVSFTSLTPWYAITSLTASSGTIGSVAGIDYEIDMDCDLEGRFELVLSGYFASPKITLTDNLGNTIGTLDLQGQGVSVTTTGEAVVVSTLPGKIGVWFRNTGGVLTNLIDKVNFVTGQEVFFLLPPRDKFTLSVRSTASSHTIVGDLNVYSYWKTR